MEHADPVPSLTPSSENKKKSKKDKKKKRKHDEVEALSSPSPAINGTKNGISSTGKKKKKDKKKQKKESNGDSVSKSSPSPEQDQQPTPTKSQELSPPPAAAIQKLSSQKRPSATATSGPGSIFSLVATSSASNKKKSPYQIKTIQGSVALLPSSVQDVSQTIRSLLHSLLLMYDANMGGVLLSVEEEGIKLLPIDDGNGGRSRSSGLIGGRIVDDLPYVHYRFQVKGLLFCPVVGVKLKGQVVECTPTFITLTTNHILSTKISTERLHEVGFFYNSATSEWTRERDAANVGVAGGEEGDNGVLGPSTSIYLDDSVEFVVGRIHECGGYIFLDGTQPSVSALG